MTITICLTLKNHLNISINMSQMDGFAKKQSLKLTMSSLSVIQQNHTMGLKIGINGS